MVLVYKSEFYALYQNDIERCYFLDFGHKTIKFSFCQLLALRHKINSISITDHFDSSVNKHGFEVLTLCNKSHLFVFNTLEILDLNQLIQQSLLAVGISIPCNSVACVY